MSLHYGPLNKSFYTQKLELIAKFLIQAPEKINFHSELDKQKNSVIFWLDIEDSRINLSDLFKKANFSHISLNQSDSQNYTEKFNLKIPAGIKNKMPHLTLAEKSVIKAYSACSEPFNALLYGNKYFPHDKKTIIDCVMLASGLNKISTTTIYNLPDDIPNAILPPLRTYRGEIYMTAEIIQTRKSLIEQGGGITAQHGFMSTSYQQKVSDNFSKESLIIFENMYGKDITELANDPKEQEFLLPPCQIFWTKFEQQSTKNVFYGKIVEPLNENNEDPTPEEMAAFQLMMKLLQLPQAAMPEPTASPLPSSGAAPAAPPLPPSPASSQEGQEAAHADRPLRPLNFKFHPYKVALFISGIVLGGSVTVGTPLLWALGYATIIGTVTLIGLSLRNNFYRHAQVNMENLSLPQNAAFENGRKAARGWQPYFNSQFSTTNWRNIREFAAGYQEELNKPANNQHRP